MRLINHPTSIKLSVMQEISALRISKRRQLKIEKILGKIILDLTTRLAILRQAY
jgi:hypothetical protein